MIFLVQQALSSAFTTIVLGNMGHAHSGQLVCLVPRNLDIAVFSPAKELCQRKALVISRKTALDPLLESASNHGSLDSSITAEAPHDSKPLITVAGIPAMGCLGAIEIRPFMVTLGGSSPSDDSVLDVGLEHAVVRTIRCTDKHKLIIMLVDIPIDLLPILVGVASQRIASRFRGEGQNRH